MEVVDIGGNKRRRETDRSMCTLKGVLVHYGTPYCKSHFQSTQYIPARCGVRLQANHKAFKRVSPPTFPLLNPEFSGTYVLYLAPLLHLYQLVA